MTKTFDLTPNELRAALVLVQDCLNSMGGERPNDLDDDPYTWVDIRPLLLNGWSKPEAAGTFSALTAKGIISEYDKGEMVLTTSAYRWLDQFYPTK